MKTGWKKMALGASASLLLLALGACGERVENSEMPQPAQANVEINRQGMEGAQEANQAQGVANDTTAMGSAPGTAQEKDDREARGAADGKS